MKFGYPGGDNMRFQNSSDIINEYKEVCELLIRSCTKNPNVATPGGWWYGGWTPIQHAAFKSNEILFNIFAPFVEDPHDLDPYGESLIQRVGKTVKFTATYLKCVSALNFPHRAAWAGHWLLGWPKQL